MNGLNNHVWIRFQEFVQSIYYKYTVWIWRFFVKINCTKAIFSAMPTAAMPPLPQLGGYQDIGSNRGCLAGCSSIIFGGFFPSVTKPPIKELYTWPPPSNRNFGDDYSSILANLWKEPWENQKKMCRFHLYGLEWWTCSLILWHQTSSSLQRMPWESKGTYPANLSWSKATLNKAVRPYFPGGVALRGALKIPWTSNCRSYPTFFHMHVFFKILGAKDVKISLWLLQKETYFPPWTQIEATFDLGLENLAIFTPPKKWWPDPKNGGSV